MKWKHPHPVSLAVTALALIAAMSAVVQAGEEPKAPEVGSYTMKHVEGFITRKGIEGNYTVTFHIMRAPAGMRHSKDHYHLMVSIDRNGKALTDIDVLSEVRHPDGSAEKKLMLRMGDWFLARYNLDHELGRHWIVVTFTTVDGKTHSSGTYYPERPYRRKP